MSGDTKDPLQDYGSFKNINEAWELKRTAYVVVREESFRLELWHSFSNPDIPYYVSIYLLEDSVWTRMPDQPFSVGRHGDVALSFALSFLNDRGKTEDAG